MLKNNSYHLNFIYLLFSFLLSGCVSMNNYSKPDIINEKGGYYFKTIDNINLFIYDYQPIENYTSTIFFISGITGINHDAEKDIIELLSNKKNRIVVIHPRGTAFSEGKRGDISDIKLFINDYREIIMKDTDYLTNKHPIFLYGHSMSTSVLMAVAIDLKNIDGAILINPPYLQKAAKGMSPTFGQYIKYASYMLFAKHKPIVNMAGNPSLIENESDRQESEQRLNDTLLVKYFSMYYMNETRKLLNSMIDYAKKADFPLLLIYGLKDPIVDKKGCDLIFENWKNPDKTYCIIENSSHGKSTVLEAKNIILEWIEE